MAGGDRPKELYIDEKWDKCIDISLRRVVYGTLTGGVLALLLFSMTRRYMFQLLDQ